MQRALSWGWVLAIAIGLLSNPSLAAEQAGFGTLELNVSTADGVPLAGVQVIVVGRTAVVTDDAGVAVVEGVRAGQREVRFKKPGFATVTRTASLDAGGTALLKVTMAPIEIDLREVVVASGYAIGDAQGGSAGTSLDRDAISRLPAFGEDIYRSVSALPGTSSSDLSSRFSIRGGLDRETLVQLDGLELFEPFHLKDYQGVFSIVDPAVVGGINLVTGGMPVENGDRSAGVLSLETLTPDQNKTELGVSFSNLWARNQGTFGNGKGGWMVSGRRGFLDIVLSISGEGDDEEDGDGGAPSPQYWDLYGKVYYDVSPTNRWTFSMLASGDSLEDMENEGGEIEDYDTRYGNSYVWANNRLIFPQAKLFLESTVYAGRVDRDRRLFRQEFDDVAEARDERTLDMLGLTHNAVRELNANHSLKWGFGARRYSMDYDYENTLEIESVIGDVRFADPVGQFAFDETFEDTTWFAYFADRFRAGRVTAELGLRYDRDFLGDDWVAPRVNVILDAGAAGEFRFGAGRYNQSQRPNELDVPDGETTFFETERVDGYFLGWSRDLPRGYGMRVDLYDRRVDNPRPRYENLLSPWNDFPEAANDRVRIAGDHAVSRGVELLLVVPSRPAWDWWVSYTWSEAFDRVDGRDQPRWFDQPHAFRANVNYKPSPKWNINGLFTWHTGWPTTPVTAITEPDGEGGLRVVPQVGEFYSERLANYHRLDVRASRAVPLKRGSLYLYVDLQNVYGRANPRGFEYPDTAFEVNPDGSVLVNPQSEDWLGLLPSFGLNWTW